jgi:hypothetical protein
MSEQVSDCVLATLFLIFPQTCPSVPEKEKYVMQSLIIWIWLSLPLQGSVRHIKVRKEAVECEYLVDSRLCKAITEQSEGRDVRRKFCKNSPKDYCCYLCSDRENCEISCSYLDTPGESLHLDSTISSKIEGEIKKYEEEKAKLSVLLANGKIGEQSYLAATKTLESKIDELKKIKESPAMSQKAVTALHESNEFERAIDLVAKPTALWYLVPFFFGIIGGIVAYVGTKDDDKGMAESLLLFGIIWTIILVVAYFAILSSILSRF